MIAEARAEGRDVDSQLDPLPDWVTYHNTAESMYCPPWELFEADDPQPPKWWWRETRILLNAGRSLGQRQKRE